MLPHIYEYHLIRFNNFAKDNQKNITTIQYHKDGSWVDKKENANNLDTISIGNVELLIDNIDYSSKSVNVSSLNSGVSFNKLFSEECLTVDLPTIVLNNNQSLNISNPQTLDVQMIEEDKNGNIGKGNKFNITFGFDGSSNNDVEVSGVKGESVSFDEIEDTDVWRSFIYSSLGTEFLWDKSSESLKLIYHGDESYGEVYLTSEFSETKTTTSDVLLITDTEIASVGSRNLVIIGGSCINSAAASLVGGKLCGPEWTTATGIGAGEYLIKGYMNSTITSELALLVAGYEVADTQNAVSYLQTLPVDTDEHYKGTTSTSATII